MNYEPERLQALLRDIKGERSQNWLARALDVTEKAVGPWLRGGGIHDDNIGKIEELAQRHGIEPALYQRPRLLWDFRRTYEANINVPVPEAPRVPPQDQAVTTILGHPVTGVVGAAASVLTSNAQLIRYLANVGLEIIVYKTVRSRAFGAHHGTNAYVCDEYGLLKLEGEQHPRHVTPVDHASPPFKALINRYGMPSAPPEQWTIDFRAASANLRLGQLLILSVTGTAAKTDPPQTLIDDFAKVVGLGRNAGAKVIELNLSCPNCSGQEGEVFKDRKTTVAICEAARNTVGSDTKLLIKLGYLPPEQLIAFVHATTEYVDGYSAINSFPVEAEVDGQNGRENAFGQPGLKAGLTGRPILPLGLATVQALDSCRQTDGLEFCILASGGITEPSDVLTYLDAGADAVMLATALFSDPLFALRARPLWRRWRSSLSDRADPIELTRWEWSKAMTTAASTVHDAEQLSTIGGAVFAQWVKEFKSSPPIPLRRPGTGLAERLPDRGYFLDLIVERAKRVRYES